jgi:hypothetical protein
MLLNTVLSTLQKVVRKKHGFILKKYNEGCKTTLKHTYIHTYTHTHTHIHTHTYTHKHNKQWLVNKCISKTYQLQRGITIKNIHNQSILLVITRLENEKFLNPTKESKIVIYKKWMVF